MRRGLAIFLVLNTIIVFFLVRSVFTLLTLLVEDGAADAIHPAEIPAPNSPLIDDRPHLIPKIIHQTYVNDTVPERWREAQKSCVDLHEDYEYRVCLICSQRQTRMVQVRVKVLTIAETSALDGRQVTRAHSHRIPLVPFDLR